MMWHAMDGWSWAWGSGMMGFGWLLMVLFWGLIIVGIAALIRWFSSASSGIARAPVDILKERYAKGEITKDQFEQMKRDIGA